MSLLADIADSTLVTILSGCIATFAGIFRWIFQRFEDHDDRIAELERDFLTRENFEKSVLQTYTKMDDGFKRLHDRIDKLFELATDPKD